MRFLIIITVIAATALAGGAAGAGLLSSEQKAAVSSAKIDAKLNRLLAKRGPRGPRGLPGKPGLLSKAKLSYHSQEATLGGIDAQNVYALCSTGEFVISGGFIGTAVGRVVASVPIATASQEGWGALIVNTLGAPAEVTVAAVCVKP